MNQSKKTISAAKRLWYSLLPALLMFGCLDRETGVMNPQGKDDSSTNASSAATAVEPITGLNFPSNGQTFADVRFRFTGANLQPMYPATYVWRINNRRQAGYYTTFYWGPGGQFTGTGYYGANPYPAGQPKDASTTHNWGISVYHDNFINDANGHSTLLVYDTWKTQALRVSISGTSKIHEFYWDLPDTTKVIRMVLNDTYVPPANPSLNFGAPAWNPTYERLSGIIRGIQLYSVRLTAAEIVSESNTPKSTAAGTSGMWYLNLNPTPTDITDKSGRGHNPVWASTARATLWTDSTTTTPTAPSVSLAANPTSIASGNTSTLTWSSTNATACAASGAWSGAKPTIGSQVTAALTATSTFTLTCTGPGGSTAQSATVTVGTTPPPMPTLTLSANPTTVNSGGTSTLSWTSANATSCVAGGGWSGNKAVNGSEVTAALSANAVFTLMCTGSGGSVNRSVMVTVTNPPPTGSITGLSFPSTGQTNADVRFRFKGSSLQPMYPATYIWRVNVRRQAGYYTTFFWGPDDQFTGTGYYGAHPYPAGEPKAQSTTHNWELSILHDDFINDVNGHSTIVAYDTWKTQALRVRDNGATKIHEFFWDLPDTTKVIRVVLEEPYGPPSNPALNFGDAAWNVGNERLSGILRGIQLYSAYLTPAEIIFESNAPMSTMAGNSGMWYLNLNPTPTDISDKSGRGHNPAWVGSTTATLWQGP